jgi:hypothetical protein
VTKRKEEIKKKNPNPYRAIEKPRFDDTKKVCWESERILGLTYEIRQNHVILYGGVSGTIAVDLSVLKKLIEDLEGVDEAYGDYIS